jgi:Immunity protein Imm1
MPGYCGPRGARPKPGVTDEQVVAVIADQHLPWTEVFERTGLSLSAAKKRYRRSTGHEPPPRLSRPRNAVPDDRVVTVLDDPAKSWADVSKATGLSARGTHARYEKITGHAPPARTGRTRFDVADERIIEPRDFSGQQVTFAEIARRVGMSLNGVSLRYRALTGQSRPTRARARLVRWQDADGRQVSRRVTSPAALDRVLGQLHEQAVAAGMPHAVSLYGAGRYAQIPDSTASPYRPMLTWTVGTDLTPVWWAEPGSPELVSAGASDNPEPAFAYRHGIAVAAAPAWALVPQDLARKAARRFFASGQRARFITFVQPPVAGSAVSAAST